MHRTITTLLTFAAAMAAIGRPLAAQNTSDVQRAEIERDLQALERKVVSLAEAMPADRYGWTPMVGVRTVAEVYLHIAGTSYFFPTSFGVNPPSASSVTSDYASVEAFEAAGGTKAEIVAKLRDSFQFLRTALEQTKDMDESVSGRRRPATVRWVWLQLIAHIHEHLGQSIAYARANHVVPPWSQ